MRVHSHLRIVTAIVLALLGAATTSTSALAAEGYVYQAAYRLRMSEKETVTFRDYFASVGSREGVVVGDTVEVIRAVPGANALWGGVSPLIEVVLGEARVLAVSPAGSIIRMTKLNSPDQVPVLQYPRFMIGDLVRTKISFAKQEEPSLE